MNKNCHRPIAIVAMTSLLVVAPLLSEVSWAQPTPGFKTIIPKSVLTPDAVQTRIGSLEFFDGIPTKKTASAILTNLDLNRGIETFLNGMPASNFEAARRGHIAIGQKQAHQVVIFDQLMDSNSLFLTGNAGTVYFTTFLDLKRDGPTVIEMPGGTGPGIAIDASVRTHRPSGANDST